MMKLKKKYKYDTGKAPCEIILMVRLKDLIHRVKGLELHTKPHHKNSSHAVIHAKEDK